VPWVNAQQRKFSERDLPGKTDKRALYELGKAMLTERGYFDVGMDHFARRDDALWKAKLDGTLHRNFMG
jgi:oxygen-independent coproporphyrinogen III oxidase